MKARWLLALAATVLALGGAELLARWAVERNAAGALLSPGGAIDVIDLFVALCYLLFRLGSVAMIVLDAAMAAGDLTSWALRRLSRRQASSR